MADLRDRVFSDFVRNRQDERDDRRDVSVSSERDRERSQRTTQESSPTPSPSQRIACVDVPALPLQLVLREHPTWRDDPVVVVEDDRPQSRVLWLNLAADRLRIERGMRFNQAEAVASRLRAAVVPDEQIRCVADEILRLLLRFTPNVEPASGTPGIFWLDASGLGALHPGRSGLDEWAGRIHAALADRGFDSSVVVGFQRARACAIARARAGRSLVLDDPREERRLAEAVPLARLDISPRLRDQMALLGVRTLADFLQLRAGDLLTRYGEEAARLHREASGDVGAPLAPARPLDAVRVEVEIDPPDDSLPRLVFAMKRALRDAAALLAARSEAVTAMRLALRLDRAPAREERIETAAPTLDVTRLSDLVWLRLASVRLAAPVESVVMEMESVRVHPRQIALLQIEREIERRPRDIEAASRALARVKAAFGSDAVACARIVRRHLPEASFRWEPVTRVRLPRCDRRERDGLGALDHSAAGAAAPLTLVRDLYAAPIPLPPIPGHEPEAWLGARGAVERIHGPFRVSGGWWRRRVERDYYFVETKRGEILWVFLDRVRRRWFLHGAVV